MGQPTGVARRVLAWAVVLAALPAPVAAQKDAFFDALLPLYRALSGVYGDEGATLSGHVQALTAALGRWDGSIRDLERDLRAKLQGADASTALQVHTVLASTYLDRGRFEDALKELDADIAIDPKRAAFHRLRGVALQALGRSDEAAGAFRDAWRLDATDPQNAYRLLVHRAAATTAAEVEQARRVLLELERTLVRGERPAETAPFLSVRPIDDEAGGAIAFAPAAYVRPFELLLGRQLEAGLTALGAATSADSLVTDPAMQSAPFVRAVAAFRRGAMGEALGQFEAALTRLPQSAQAYRALGTAYWVNGDITQSVEHLRQAVRVDPHDERAWLTLSQVLDESGDTTDAASVLRAAVQALPDSAELRWRLSVVSGRRQRTDEADLDLVARADRLVVLAGKGDLMGRVATLAQAHLDYDRAVALLEQRVLLTPNSAAAHHALGRAYVDMGRDVDGYAELVVALWLNPANADTLAAIGRLHLAAGRHGDAVEPLTRAATLAPTSAETVYALGEALTRGGRDNEGGARLADAERLRAAAVERQRRLRTSGMLVLEAELYRTNGNPERAIEAWRQVLALEGRSAAAHLRLADAFLSAKQLPAAAEQLELAIAARAGPDAHRRLSRVYAAMGRPEDSARERGLYTAQRLEELRARAGGP